MATQIPQIQAIPTRYKGWFFRSRLEARWAVFFESMEIEFVYEIGPTRLTESIVYLPDFYFPCLDWYAEVKPFAFTPEERWKVDALVQQTGQGCLLLPGPPDYRDYTGITRLGNEISNNEYRLDIYHNGINYYKADGRLFSGPDEELTREACSGRFGIAVENARQSRFDRVQGAGNA